MKTWFRGVAAIGAAFLLAGSIQAQTVTVPPVIQFDQPGFIYIKATSVDADEVRFFPIPMPRVDAKGNITYIKLQTIPEELVKLPPGTFVGFTLDAGEYKLGVVAAKAINGKAVMSVPQGIKVIVGTPAPPVPPIPPTPPTPPADPFLTTLQGVFSQEADLEKLAQAKQLAGLYRTAANETANDPSLATIGDYFLKVNKDIGAVLPPTVLAKTKAAMGAELSRVLPALAATPLDTTTRVLVSSNVLRMAVDLEALK